MLFLRAVRLKDLIFHIRNFPTKTKQKLFLGQSQANFIRKLETALEFAGNTPEK